MNMNSLKTDVVKNFLELNMSLSLNAAVTDECGTSIGCSKL